MYTLYPKTISSWGMGGGYEIHNFLSPYPTDDTYTKLVKIGPVVLEKKMLTHDGR